MTPQRPAGFLRVPGLLLHERGYGIAAPVKFLIPFDVVRVATKAAPAHSIAREWNEQILAAIRNAMRALNTTQCELRFFHVVAVSNR